MPRYLSKALLTIEPSLQKDEYHDTLREISAHNRSNLLDMIGVDPIVYRTETDQGTVDLQIWVTTLTGSSLNRMIMPFYFAGARKYFFMCATPNAVNFVSEVIELASDQMNALNEIIILIPSKGTKINYSKSKKAFEEFFRDKGLTNYSFIKWSNSSDLEDLFVDVIRDLLQTAPEEIGFAPIGFDLETVEQLVKNQGFEISKDHEVVLEKNDFVFKVNLLRNTVYAEMSDCFDCENDCRVSKKLCIVIADKGFSNIRGLGDLRILSILYTIVDGTIFKLKGNKPTEDMENQLKALRKEFKKKCKKE